MTMSFLNLKRAASLNDWVTPQKCPFTLSVSRLQFSIGGCPLGLPYQSRVITWMSAVIFHDR
jgi:hypothetical protein